MLTFFSKIISSIVIATLSLFGANTTQAPSAPIPMVAPIAYVSPAASSPTVGASNAIETPVALFSTYLNAPITAAATTMTLASATTIDGTTLASSTYSFIIDQGSSNQEFVQADCTATACTNMVRGISGLTGTSTIAANAQVHRRGASVKITDAPLLVKITRVINGIDTFPNIVSYTTHPTFTANTNVIDKQYADGLAFSSSAAIAATESASGYSRLATQLQQASSTATVSSSPLVLQAKYATSTFNAGAAGGNGLNVVVTQNNNTIDGNFFPASTTKPLGLNASTTVATSTFLVNKNGASLLKFGGTSGASADDGALTCTSGTTNFDLASAKTLIKNYSSISITGTCAITFTNPNTNGTIIIWKSRGDVTISSSATRAIDLRSLGGTGGAGAPGASTVGTAGTDGRGLGAFYTHGGIAVASGGSGTQGGAGFNPYLDTTLAFTAKNIPLFAGSGAAGGSTGSGATASGNGGRGAGGMYIEVGGAFSFGASATVDISGAAGTNSGGGNDGGGGGGGGGSFLVSTQTLTSNAGTVTITGGAGGTGANAGKGGGGGASYLNGLEPSGASGHDGGVGAAGLSAILQNNDF